MATDGPVSDGAAALHAGDWERARTAFAAALDIDETPEALDGMGRAHWWLADVGAAATYRARAFKGFRDRGDGATAARIAFWLAREYATVLGKPAAANGWFNRGLHLVDELPAGVARGWLDLARVERTHEPSVKERYAESAYWLARESGEPDLEIYALAARGYARIMSGDVDTGINDLDVALATAVDASSIDTVGDTLCIQMLAAELVGDADRFAQWNDVLEQYLAEHQHVNLTGFCYTCCGEVNALNGQWDDADEWFRSAIAELERAGHRSRCAHPVARLARLRIRQGRLEEAEVMLADVRELPEAAEPLAALALAQGRSAAAVSILERQLARVGDDTLPAVPLLSLLAAGHLAADNVDGARRAASKLAAMAERSGLDRVRGLAALAAGRIARAEKRGDDSSASLAAALTAFDRAAMPVEAAATHSELARLAADTGDTEAAAEAGRAALHGFERVGASHDADEVAALLRGIGVRGQTGPKGLGVLTKREREVLDLVAAGLTNAEIAERLFISTKTAGNHVSNVLLKLGVRSRTKAASLALREPSGT